MWPNSSVHSAADDVRRAIEARLGAIRFDEFLQIALYGAQGFYTCESIEAQPGSTRRTGRAGRRGDFLTSPEVGPLFGAVIARALDEWWIELDRPDPFVVVDVGAGPGTLARTIDVAQPECRSAMQYRAVEVSSSQRRLHPTWVESLDALPDETFTGVVIANELLDNLAFRLFVFDDGWREAHVAYDGERFVERLATTAPTPSCLPPTAAHGARAAVQDAAAQWVESACSRLARGRVVALDYCTTTTSMASRPWREWLRTYASHDRGRHYLSDVGEQDITVEVAIDQLPPASHVSTQAEFLQRHGIDTLVDEGREMWRQSAATADLASMMMRSRVREAETLLDHDGLGGFSVIEWSR